MSLEIFSFREKKLKRFMAQFDDKAGALHMPVLKSLTEYSWFMKEHSA